jgi:hypothetical protein
VWRKGRGSPVAAARWRGGVVGTRPAQDPHVAGAGGGNTTLSCKAEVVDAHGGTQWQREREKTGGTWASLGERKKTGQAQRNSKSFDLFRNISNEYELL